MNQDQKPNNDISKQDVWEGDLVSQNNWESYLDEDCSTTGFVGYLEANEHIIPKLKEKIEAAKSFASLKNELLNFIHERESFVKYAWNHVR